MLVREAMTRPAVTVRPGTPARSALRLLRDHAVTALPVVDDEDRLVGVVSEMDLLRGEFEPDPRASVRPAEARTGPPPRTVGAVMTRKVLTTGPNSDVAGLAEMMLRTRVKSVPVLDGHRVVGVISRSDLVALQVRDDERIRADVRTELAAYLTGSGWKVRVHDGEVTVDGDLGTADRRVVEILARTVPGVVRVTVPAAPGAPEESG
ncbi:CBS domain-containing protein [Actinomadura gamaensis]|uniref:CBS domain-containing protein n=1 Tax=Actinomadura gamaensis TaxID=1763541 RepID=A0ABV9TU90_9ACTN